MLYVSEMFAGTISMASSVHWYTFSARYLPDGDKLQVVSFKNRPGGWIIALAKCVGDGDAPFHGENNAGFFFFVSLCCCYCYRCGCKIHRYAKITSLKHTLTQLSLPLHYWITAQHDLFDTSLVLIFLSSSLLLFITTIIILRRMYSMVLVFQVLKK